MVKLQEAENQIVTDYEVYDRRPNDADLADRSGRHRITQGSDAFRAWWLADAVIPYFSKERGGGESQAASNGSALPNRSTKSPERRRERKSAGSARARNGAPAVTGRISVVKRRHGLNRCRYKGDAGMKRWVGLGVIADNLINIGRAMAKQSGP